MQLNGGPKATISALGAATFPTVDTGLPPFVGNLTDTTQANYNAIVAQYEREASAQVDYFATPAGLDHAAAFSAFQDAFNKSDATAHRPEHERVGPIHLLSPCCRAAHSGRPVPQRCNASVGLGQALRSG